jgi:hypothetical protein
MYLVRFKNHPNSCLENSFFELIKGSSNGYVLPIFIDQFLFDLSDLIA